ncbi:hypothetical protein FHL15_009390 [Xylaria flabelliformis]|uniref:EamA domain-containing protein n=1 Tax=Xylaria flabelliformis TaxID=2512241 RepID=A0A553HNY2_9PEZI|nr:hypothetical protein FHL15_009390 [Xylaria flabelliformis]
MSFIERHYPALSVIASQMVAATVNAAAKFCETRPDQVHPFMILHIRMSAAFFGEKEVRGLVFLRAVGGVFSATGFFFSMIYLTLSEAIALSFLSPLGALVLARFLSLGTIQWIDCVGAVGAVVGVVLVAQPENVFYVDAGSAASTKMHDHLKGLVFGLIGACGGCIDINSSYWHKGSSTNKCECVCMERCVHKRYRSYDGIEHKMVRESIDMDMLGIYRHLRLRDAQDPSSVATLMIYTQIIWALVVDRAFFQIIANGWALLGAATIIGSLCLVTVTGGRKVGSVHKHFVGGEDEDAEMLDMD